MRPRDHRAGRNVIVVRAVEVDADADTFGQRRTIHIWVRSMRDNGALMITLANTLRASGSWRRAQVTIRMVSPSEEGAEAIARNLDEAIANARLSATADVLIDSSPITEIIEEHAAQADLTFFGLPDPCVYGDEFAERTASLLEKIRPPTPVAFVLGTADVDHESLLS